MKVEWDVVCKILAQSSLGGTMVALSREGSCVTVGEISRLRKYFFRAH
jgi:hypothetical protein